MSKGLPRSLSRGDAQRQELVKVDIPVRGLVVNVAATGINIGFGTSVIQGLPEGNLLFLGALANLRFSGPVGGSANLVDTWNGDFSIGSAPTADNVLSGAEVDLVPSTAVGPATAEVSPVTRGANAGAVMFDNTDGSLELNLNVLIDAADIVDDTNVNLTVDGVVHLAFIVMGDD